MDSMLLCSAAHTAFELRLNGTRPTPLPVFSDLQGRISIWQDYNFGDGPAWHKAMGVAEEGAELAESLLAYLENPEGKIVDVYDAVADKAIYSMSYCTKLRLEYHTLLDLSDPIPPTPDLKVATLRVIAAGGPIFHAVLKNAQKIRGFDDERKFVAHCAVGISKLARASQNLLRLLDADFTNVVHGVAERVLQRDWKKNPVNAATLVDK